MILRHAVSWPEQGTEAAHRTITRVLVDRSREKPNVWADSVETAHRAVSGGSRTDRQNVSGSNEHCGFSGQP